MLRPPEIPDGDHGLGKRPELVPVPGAEEIREALEPTVSFADHVGWPEETPPAAPDGVGTTGDKEWFWGSGQPLF